MNDDSRERLDVRIDTPGREGLTGTTPANLYAALHDREEITTAPDGRPMDAQPSWRTDFPIDWPQDQYVERREFMKFMVLTSLAFAAGQLWIAGQNWWRRRRGQPEIVRVASVADVTGPGVVTFTYPRVHDDCILVRTADNQLVAYGQKCTHLSCAVLPQIAEGIIRCPCHEGYFDLASGRPLAGPPRRPLPRVRLDVRGGEIYATGLEVRTS
jgi:Rieske Fe-S protein